MSKVRDKPATAETDTAPHVVIIGGGFGGLAAARAFGNRPVWVTLVDRSNHHLFQPLLYQVAMAGLSPADISVPIRRILRRQTNVRVLMAEVVSVDLDQRRLTLHDSEQLQYDYLVIAAGSKTTYFGQEAAFAPHTLSLKTLEDAVAIRRRVLTAFEAAEREEDPVARKRLLTFVVIGGGPTGVEVAGALCELSRFVLADDFRSIDPSQTRVVLIEMQDRVLSAGFEPKLSEKAREQLIELGAEVRLGTRVLGIDEHGVTLHDERIEAATVLWTAGVEARRLSKNLGLETNRKGQISVEQDCSVPGHPEVFVIGDMARFVPEGESMPLPGLAPVAVQQGRYVAEAILLRARGQNVAPFRYRDKGIMATIGRSRAIAQTKHLKLSGFIAWLAWLAVHIVFLIGFQNRVAVLLNWFFSYVMYRRGARLITGERPWVKVTSMADEAAGRHGPDGEDSSRQAVAAEQRPFG